MTKARKHREMRRKIEKAKERAYTAIAAAMIVYIMACMAEVVVAGNISDCGKFNFVAYTLQQLEEQWEQKQENINEIYGW